MATAKFTIQRGKPRLQDVTLAAGTAEAQTDTISVNIDYTKLTKAEACHALESVKNKISRGKWPPL